MAFIYDYNGLHALVYSRPCYTILKDDLYSLEHFDLTKLLPLNRKNYFRYSGSLTTPPCSESVLWTVFATPQTISSAQVKIYFTRIHAVFEVNGGVHAVFGHMHAGCWGGQK